MNPGAWHRIGRQDHGASTGVDWSVAALLRRCDPYLVWSDLTSRGDAPAGLDGAERTVSVLVELDEAVSAIPGVLAVPHLHYQLQRTQFVSAEVRIADLGPIIADVAADPARGSKTFLRIELAQARERGAAFAAPAAAEAAGQALSPQQWRALRVGRRTGPLREEAGGDAPAPQRLAPLVCVIDDGCNFASMRLRADGRSRVHSVWHQGGREERAAPLQRPFFDLAAAAQAGPLAARAALPPAAQAAGGARYGMALAVQDALAAPAQALGGPPSRAPEEAAVYRRVGYAAHAGRWSHGSSVLDLVCGEDFWFGTPARRLRLASPAGGVRFVQLPAATVNDTSGGSLAVHALDGIRQALHEAQPGQPVIVNLSYGTNGGPHDGMSMFERALAELIDRFDGEDDTPALHVVLPAGNAHESRIHGHARLAAGERRVLHWKVLPDDPTDSFVELWLSRGDGVQVVVTPPGARPSPPVSPGDAFFWGDDLGRKGPRDGEVRAAVVFAPEVAQGTQGTMALVALAPTQPLYPETAGTEDASGPAPYAANTRTFRRRLRAPHGLWRIEVHNGGGAEVALHAWVQRDDAAPGRPRAARGYAGRQSVFVDAPAPAAAAQEAAAPPVPVDPAGTLNGIATLAQGPARRLWVVGAMRHGDGSLSCYSAAGHDDRPQRPHGPDVVLAGDESLNVDGLLTGSFLSGGRVRASGTSLAAALFTRVLHHHLLQGGGADGLFWPPPQAGSRPPPPDAARPPAAPAGLRGEAVRLPPGAAGIALPPATGERHPPP